MKTTATTLICISIEFLACCADGATTIVYDDFNRTGPLNASMAVTGQIWSVAGGGYNTSPSVLTLGSAVALASISGLSFINNSSYTLSADIGVSSALNPLDWVAISFSKAAWGGVTAAGSLLFRDNDSTTSFNNTSAGQQDIPGSGSFANLAIRLDTGSTLNNSMISFYRNGIQLGTTQTVDASQYSLVTIANNNNTFNANVRNFTLTFVPEPSSALLLCFGGLTLLHRRTVKRYR